MLSDSRTNTVNLRLTDLPTHNSTRHSCHHELKSRALHLPRQILWSVRVLTWVKIRHIFFPLFVVDTGGRWSITTAWFTCTNCTCCVCTFTFTFTNLCNFLRPSSFSHMCKDNFFNSFLAKAILLKSELLVISQTFNKFQQIWRFGGSFPKWWGFLVFWPLFRHLHHYHLLPKRYEEMPLVTSQHVFE